MHPDTGDGDDFPAPVAGGAAMRLSIGCELRYELPQPTPLIAMLNVHYSRYGDLEGPDHLVTSPGVAQECYRDSFGNWCTRLVAPAGFFTLKTDGVCRDEGNLDPQYPEAWQHTLESLPADTLTYLLGSRYCDTDLLSERAWQLFSSAPFGWARVQTICDYVHTNVRFDYDRARATRTASETLSEGYGVCRDFAHLAITLCRCINISARYCTGYLSDIGEPLPHPPGDFAAWMEVYLDNAWRTFDPRNNKPRNGRILIARGRDAADVPLVLTFGPNILVEFKVRTEDI